jgi:hypothetical protein
MSNDFYAQAAIQRANMIEAEMAAAQADLAAARANNDVGSASANVQALANLRAEKANLSQLYNDYVASQQAPHRPYVSEEQRQARTPGEMDAQDLADIMNTSRYSGKSFTSDDYNNLRRGLGSYKYQRGVENK